MNETLSAATNAFGNFIYGRAAILDHSTGQRAFGRSGKISIQIDRQVLGMVYYDPACRVLYKNKRDPVSRSVLANYVAKALNRSRCQIACCDFIDAKRHVISATLDLLVQNPA